MDNGLIETRHLGDFGIGMQGVFVAREAVEQGLLGQRH